MFVKKLKLTFDDYQVYADLCYEKIPLTLETIEQNLPAKGLLRHAKICDNEWMLPLPFKIDVDEPANRLRPVPGDIGFNAGLQIFCGWYSPMKPLGFTNKIATVAAKDMPEYAKQMSRCWDDPGQVVTIEIVEVEE